MLSVCRSGKCSCVGLKPGSLRGNRSGLDDKRVLGPDSFLQPPDLCAKRSNSAARAVLGIWGPHDRAFLGDIDGQTTSQEKIGGNQVPPGLIAEFQRLADNTIVAPELASESMNLVGDLDLQHSEHLGRKNEIQSKHHQLEPTSSGALQLTVGSQETRNDLSMENHSRMLIWQDALGALSSLALSLSALPLSATLDIAQESVQKLASTKGVNERSFHKSAVSTHSFDDRTEMAKPRSVGQNSMCRSERKSASKVKPKESRLESSAKANRYGGQKKWIMSLRQVEPVSKENMRSDKASICVGQKSMCKSNKSDRTDSETFAWSRPYFVEKGLLSVVWRLLCSAPQAVHTIAEGSLVRRWLNEVFDSPLPDPRTIKLCYHGTTAGMVPLVIKCGFRLPKLHPCLYATTKFKVADFYASSTKGGFHSACGAAFADLQQHHEDNDMFNEVTGGSVIMCLGLNPAEGPAYLRYMKAERLLPCYVVKSRSEARVAATHVRPLISALLNILPWGADGAVLECFRTWSMHATIKSGSRFRQMRAASSSAVSLDKCEWVADGVVLECFRTWSMNAPVYRFRQTRSTVSTSVSSDMSAWLLGGAVFECFRAWSTNVAAKSISRFRQKQATAIPSVSLDYSEGGASFEVLECFRTWSTNTIVESFKRFRQMQATASKIPFFDNSGCGASGTLVQCFRTWSTHTAVNSFYRFRQKRGVDGAAFNASEHGPQRQPLRFLTASGRRKRQPSLWSLI